MDGITQILNLPNGSPMLTRERAAAYLAELGYPITPSRLAKLAVYGGGPPYRKWGRHAVYKPETLLEWAEKRGGNPVEHTSQALP